MFGKTKRQATVGLKNKLRKNEPGEGELTSQPLTFPRKIPMLFLWDLSSACGFHNPSTELTKVSYALVVVQCHLIISDWKKLHCLGTHCAQRHLGA